MTPRPTVVLDDVHVAYSVFEDRSAGIRELLDRRTRRAPRRIHAVRGVSAEFHEGETVGIVGSNGSGKSTLLSAITGLLPVESGRVLVRSRPRLLGVGSVMRPSLSGRRNILIGGLALGMTQAEIEQRADDIIEFAGLEDFIDLPMRTYSSGMRARLMFSIATSVRPEILLIDEALAVGDEAFRQRSRDRLESIREQAGTVVLVSHNHSEIRDSCARVLWLEHGEIAAFGPADEVMEAYEDATRDRLGDDADQRQLEIHSTRGERDEGRSVRRSELGPRKVTLHVGGSLAGNRAIQRFLGVHADQLRVQGLATPEFLGRRNHYAFAAYASELATRDLLKREPDDAWSEWRQALRAELIADVARDDADWVISSEGIGVYLDDDGRDILVELLRAAGFDEIEVLLFARRQDELAAESYTSMVVHGSTEPFDPSMVTDDPNRYDFEAVAARWEASPAVSAVRVRLFPDPGGRDPVRAFLDLIGRSELSASSEIPIDDLSSFEVDAPLLEFLRLLNVDQESRGIPRRRRGPYPRRVLRRLSDGRYRLPIADAKAIMTGLEESNAAVLARVPDEHRDGSFFDGIIAGELEKPGLADAARYAAALWSQRS